MNIKGIAIQSSELTRERCTQATESTKGTSTGAGANGACDTLQRKAAPLSVRVTRPSVSVESVCRAPKDQSALATAAGVEVSVCADCCPLLLFDAALPLPAFAPPATRDQSEEFPRGPAAKGGGGGGAGTTRVELARGGVAMRASVAQRGHTWCHVIFAGGLNALPESQVSETAAFSGTAPMWPHRTSARPFSSTAVRTEY